MDNLFDVLIVIFFVVSIFGSLFKKKKPQHQQQMPQRSQTPDTGRQLPKKRDAEILQDLFGLKLPQPVPEPAKPKYDTRNLGNEVSWDPEKEFKEPVSVEQQASVESKPAKYYDIPDVNYDKLVVEYQALEKAAYKVPESASADSEKLELSQHGIDVKRLIKKPGNLNDLIIISEILKKPLAFRR
ncbi:MAG: hypothetical protein V1720_17940 [bacterium]